METLRKPSWLKKKVFSSTTKSRVLELLEKSSLNTVCQEAKCPNLCECFDKGIATFMIMGDTCTRNCSFCAIKGGSPKPLDIDEPSRIAEAVKTLNLNHVVITSVTRDDLKDGGASHFRKSVDAIHSTSPKTIIEILTPDFKNDKESIREVLKSNVHIFNHNLETVPRLYNVRRGASFEGSLEFLKFTKEESPHILTKSGIMVGLGETEDEVLEVIKKLYNSNCDILTIGQYLQPSKAHTPVIEYIKPEQFEAYKKFAEILGFQKAFCGPFVRSSYMAEAILKDNNKHLIFTNKE